MDLGQALIIFMSLLILIPFTLQCIDEMVTERKEKFYKNIRNKARKEVRLQQEAEEKVRFLMELR